MQWFRFFCCILSLLLAGQAAATQELQNQPLCSLFRFLYGDQWKLAQYCNDTRDSEKILQDDISIEMLYNGSLFRSHELIGDLLDDAQIIGAQSRQQLSVLCSINSWGYADKFLEHQSNRPHENESECSDEVEKFSKFVDNFVGFNKTRLSLVKLDLEHWRQFNSFGRLRSGPTHNNDLLIGDYDACGQVANARYCVGSYSKYIDGVHNHDQVTRFKVGLCLPQACSPRILRKSRRLMQAINLIVKENLPTSSLHSSYELQDVHCQPLKDSPWLTGQTKHDLVTKILIYHMPLVWLFMLTVGTLSGSTRLDGTNFHRKYIKPFDIRHNWRSFLRSDHLDPKLAGINGAKVLCMIWLLMSHVSMSINPYLEDAGRIRPYTWHGAVVLQGQHGVPLFFIISGLLAGLRYLKKRGVSTMDMLISRYFRLVPLYLLIYAYVKKFAHLTNDGPFWDYGVSVQSEARQCMNESWLVPLLLLANFTPPFAHCIITGWHIANDFQIFLILPLLFWLYRKSLWIGRAAVIVTFLVTHLSHVWFWATSSNFSYYTAAAEPALYGPRIVLDRVSLDYVNPLGRVGTYFVGVLVADLLLASGGRFNTRQTRRVTFNEKKPLTKQLGAVADQEGEEELDDSNNIRLDTLAIGKQQLDRVQDHHQAADINDNGSGHHTPEASSGHKHDHKRGSVGDGRRNLSPKPYSEPAASICENVISTFKDNAVLLFGMQAAYLSLFTVIWPTRMKLLFEPYSKPLAYPWVRLNVELGWAICLYYLLRDNGAHDGDGGQEKARPRTRLVSATETERREKTKLALSDDHDDGHRARELKNSHSQLAPSLSTSNGHGADQSSTSGRFNLSFGGSLLKFRFWNVLVKLNYALMLVHFSVIRYFVQSQRQLLVFSWTSYFQLTTFILVVTYAICVVIHLAIEMPLMALIKLLILKITFR